MLELLILLIASLRILLVILGYAYQLWYCDGINLTESLHNDS